MGIARAGPEMGVGIQETRQHGIAGKVNGLRARRNGEVGANLGDPAIGDDDISVGQGRLFRVGDEPAAVDVHQLRRLRRGQSG